MWRCSLLVEMVDVLDLDLDLTEERRRDWENLRWGALSASYSYYKNGWRLRSRRTSRVVGDARCDRRGKSAEGAVYWLGRYVIALALDEDIKDRPFCGDAVLHAKRTISSTYQLFRAISLAIGRSGFLCVLFIHPLLRAWSLWLHSLPPHLTTHSPLGSMNSIGIHALFALRYIYYFITFISLYMHPYVPRPMHIPFLLFISFPRVCAHDQFTHTLLLPSRRRLLSFLPPDPPLSIAESTFRRAKHCTAAITLLAACA